MQGIFICIIRKGRDNLGWIRRNCGMHKHSPQFTHYENVWYFVLMLSSGTDGASGQEARGFRILISSSSSSMSTRTKHNKKDKWMFWFACKNIVIAHSFDMQLFFVCIWLTRLRLHRHGEHLFIISVVIYSIRVYAFIFHRWLITRKCWLQLFMLRLAQHRLNNSQSHTNAWRSVNISQSCNTHTHSIWLAQSCEHMRVSCASSVLNIACRLSEWPAAGDRFLYSFWRIARNERPPSMYLLSAYLHACTWMTGLQVASWCAAGPNNCRNIRNCNTTIEMKLKNRMDVRAMEGRRALMHATPVWVFSSFFFFSVHSFAMNNNERVSCWPVVERMLPPAGAIKIKKNKINWIERVTITCISIKKRWYRTKACRRTPARARGHGWNVP